MDRAGFSAELARAVAFFEGLTRADVERLATLYTADAAFKDPFNEVRGLPAITRIFAHMFVQVHEPRFVVTAAFQQDREAFLAWEFRFRMKRFDMRTSQVVRGATHLQFAADGRIAAHRDYWDAAEELYEKLPVVGAFMRWLKRRANA
jgi:ketosteroid isomerase-like protein